MRSLPGGDEDRQSLQYLLWKHKLTIILAIAVLALAASTYYFYGLSGDRAAALNNKSADYDALSLQLYNLSGEHASLIASNKNLSERFENLSGQYNDLSSNASTVIADYEKLSGIVGRFQENTSTLALYYQVSRAETADGPRVLVKATVYNVGNSRVDRITIKCKTIFENQPNVDEHVVTGLGPLEKKTITWNYSSYADIDALWI
jgi:hypothetical protein